MQKIIINKIYQHYKGNLYKIIAIGKHSETEEEMVVYQNIEKKDIWIRPKSMWNDIIEINNKKMYRFSLVD